MDHDMTLLRDYASRGSESAFASLITQHIGLVYSSALRQVLDPLLAEEITQAVFILLARKAGSLSEKTILAGWLYHTTRFIAANELRKQYIRQRHEKEASMQSSIDNKTEPASIWKELSPLLDEAMNRLGSVERDALLLRYFENKSFLEVGTALNINAEAARKRVARGLDKLRASFAKRGITLSQPVIAEVVSAFAVSSIPQQLTKFTTATALSHGAVANHSTLTVTQGALKYMALTKIKTGLTVAAIVLLTGGSVILTVEKIEKHKTFSWQVPKANFSVFYETTPQVKIVPTHLKVSLSGADVAGSSPVSIGSWVEDESRGTMGIAETILTMLQIAYDKDALHSNLPSTLSEKRYDFFAKLAPGNKVDTNWIIAFRREIKKKFGLVGKIELQERNVLVLKLKNPNLSAFKPSDKMPGGRAIKNDSDAYAFFEQPLSSLVNKLERFFKTPIVDETSLTGNYDYSIKWNGLNPENPNLEILKQSLLDQLGLELVPNRQPIEMLVLEK